MKRLRVALFAIVWISCLMLPSAAQATTQQEVYVTGSVGNFGGYRFTEAVTFDFEEAGEEQELGWIIVENVYNGPYPWLMRVYTDNLDYTGTTGSIRQGSTNGLISDDGMYSIPIQINCPNFGEDVFREVPDINDANYVAYDPTNELGGDYYTDVIVMGIDPRNPSWVSGGDELLYTGDDNILGDTTVETPFEIILQADVSESAVQGTYETMLYFEIVSAP